MYGGDTVDQPVASIARGAQPLLHQIGRAGMAGQVGGEPCRCIKHRLQPRGKRRRAIVALHHQLTVGDINTVGKALHLGFHGGAHVVDGGSGARQHAIDGGIKRIGALGDGAGAGL